MWAMSFALGLVSVLSRSAASRLLTFLQGVVIEMVARQWQHWLVGKIVTGLGQGLVQQSMLTVSFMDEISARAR